MRRHFRSAHIMHLLSGEETFMRKIFLVWTVLIAASFLLISCGDQGAGNAGNAGNKPANTANNAAAPVDLAAVEAEVKKMVNETAAALAKNDVAALEKLYADNYMLVNLDGSVSTKAERLATLKSGETKFDSFTYDEINVRVRPEGGGAIVIARANAKGVNNGKPIADAGVRVTHVWRKNPSGWQLVTAQGTTITAAAAKPDNKAPANSAASNSNAAKPSPPANK